MGMNKMVIILFGLTISRFLSILLIESQTITTTYQLEMGEQITVPGSLGDHTINYQGYNRLIIDGEKKLVYQGDPARNGDLPRLRDGLYLEKLGT